MQIKKYLTMLGMATSLVVAALTHAQQVDQKPAGQPKTQNGQTANGQAAGQKMQSEAIKGKTMVVDVDDSTRTPATRIKKGSKIVAVGKEARIDGKPLHAAPAA